MSREARSTKLLEERLFALRGTRGLTLAAGALLVFATVEPALPRAFPALLYTLPLFLVLLLGFFTLPREAVAVQLRARVVIDDPEAVKRMMKRAAFGGAVCIALVPNLFLAVQGVPYLNPLVGLVHPAVIRWVSLVGMLVVLLLSVLYLRSSRSYAPWIATPRRGELTPPLESRRDVLAVLILLVVVGWGWMLQGFWRPFSLLQWHGADLAGYFESLRVGARGISAIAFAVIPPALLFVVLTAHLDLLWVVKARGVWRERKAVASMALVHVALCLLGVALHTYNVLWLVRYRTWGFF